jgi:hypothetical protein
MLAAAPFESGVPIVVLRARETGGLQDGYESGGPCVLFDAVHWL